MKSLALLTVASLLSLVACSSPDSASSVPAEDESDLTSASCMVKVEGKCIKSGMKVIPREPDFTEEKCLRWNRERGEGKLFKTTKRSTTQKQDELTIAMLRLTLQHFQIEAAEVKRIQKMTVPELFKAADGPVFRRFTEKASGAEYVHVNIALGDNPMDVVFRAGTLDPVVVLEDDSVAFCADDVKGK